MIRVLLVDDSEQFLSSAADFLSRHPRVTVVGCARSGAEGVRLTREFAPNLVVMDLAMPAMNGLDATRLMKAQPAPPAVVIVTIYDEAAYRRRAQEVGADGFIGKSQFTGDVTAFIDGLLDDAAPHSLQEDRRGANVH